MYSIDRSESLTHHGVLGQKWGVRRYQNPDGSLTSAGKKHYKKDGIDAYTSELNKRTSDMRKHLGVKETKIDDVSKMSKKDKFSKMLEVDIIMWTSNGKKNGDREKYLEIYNSLSNEELKEFWDLEDAYADKYYGKAVKF